MEEETPNWLEQEEAVTAWPTPLERSWYRNSLTAALEVSIRELPSEAEKQTLYERLFALIDLNERDLQWQALRCIANAFNAENGEDDKPVDSVLLRVRLEVILSAIERRLPDHPELLENFCTYFRSWLIYASRNEQIREWLNRLAASGDTGLVPIHALLAARILCGAYGRTWKEAGDRLLAALDHEDRTVRACAAHEIGTFCCNLALKDPKYRAFRRLEELYPRSTEGMAPLADYWALIHDKEIERPGVAIAFWESAPTWAIDADEWLLTLLEQAKSPPHMGYFPSSLEAEAYDRYDGNPPAIRRLIDAGHIRIAVKAATAEPDPVPGLEPLLWELSENDDTDIVRRASWTLAFCYHRLHPNGERLGYVRHFSDRPDCDLFLLFLEDGQNKVPHTAILYPKPPRRQWTRKEGEALVDRIFPSVARGEVQEAVFPGPNHTQYQRGVVDFYATSKRSNARGVSRIAIGYRSDM